MNLSARVESQAEGGEIVVSQDTHDSVFWDRDITAMKGDGKTKSAVELMLEGVVCTSKVPAADCVLSSGLLLPLHLDCLVIQFIKS